MSTWGGIEVGKIELKTHRRDSWRPEARMDYGRAERKRGETQSWLKEAEFLGSSA